MFGVNVLTYIKDSLSLLPQFSVRNLLEVFIIAVIVYELLLLIKNTRAWTLLKGILVILLFTLLAAVLQLDTILWILERISTIAVLAVLIIFQPELRKALEQLGNQKIVNNLFALNTDTESKELTRDTIEQIVKATFEMAKKKTGALMVLEQTESLSDVEKTGIEIDGVVSSGLLINIFEKNTPLHDGAVLLRGNKVAAATCYLPLSDNLSISKDLGTRHRAALGISESTDSLTIIVSEETGRVTVAQKGELTRMPDAEALRRVLLELLEDEETRRFSVWRRSKGKTENTVAKARKKKNQKITKPAETGEKGKTNQQDKSKTSGKENISGKKEAADKSAESNSEERLKESAKPEGAA